MDWQFSGETILDDKWIWKKQNPFDLLFIYGNWMKTIFQTDFQLSEMNFVFRFRSNERFFFNEHSKWTTTSMNDIIN